MPNPLQSLRPDTARKMMSEMSNRQTLKWVAFAAVFHLVLIGTTSIGYMRDHWIDPRGAQARAAQAEAEAQAQSQQPSSDATAAHAQATKAPATPVKPPNPDDEKAILDQRRDTPEVKRITSVPKPGETPKTPSHDGFNLDDGLK